MRKTMTMIRKRQSGMSLIEVLAGLAIVSVMVLGTVTVMSNAHHLTKLSTNKQFATEKAISLIEELKSLVQTNSGSTIVDLDAYDDGITNKTLLTTVGELDTPQTVMPGDVISGNTLIAAPDTWQYERRINVTKIAGQANDVRLVDVKVFENTPGGQILLSEVSSIIRTLVDNMPPTQVYDVYCLAIENVPGWWVYMSNVVPFVRNAINDLQSRNPGLVFRTHWINTLAYGRDQLYKPFVNNSADSVADVNSVYFYPGKMPASCVSAGNCGDDYYYPYFFFRGRISVDGTDTNGYDAANNPHPYAIADQFNNAMRYYDEMALFNARKTANSNEEMTWRLLMDDMYMNPTNYTNALIINLHGELMPFPPVRNYSDAAKSPGQTLAPDLRGVRAVIHPEQLRYAAGDWVTLRVYTYLADPTVAPPSNAPTPAGILPMPLTIRISGLASWAPSNAAGCLPSAPPVAPATTCNVQAIRGGVDADASGAPDSYDAAPVAAAAAPAAGYQMQWSSSIDGPTGDTIIKLYNSPLVSPIDDATGRGLSREDRLYGVEYIPSPVEDLTTGAVQFSTDLTSTAVRPKNTARWIIKIPASAFPAAVAGSGTVLGVDTRIGDQQTSGAVYPTAVDPENFSRTYVWRGDNTYIFGTAAQAPKLPITERYQVLGDPRHCPYADLKRPHVSNTFPSVAPPAVGSYESSLGMGYNRYFDDFEDPNRNRGGSAELTSSKVEPYTIATSGAGQNNIFAVKIDGGAVITVALPAGNLSAYTIANTLNSNATFAAVATADPPVSPAVSPPIFNRVRITSKGRAGSSVQFNTGTANDCGATVGFNNNASTIAGWPGWVYTVAGQQYGVNNNGNQSDAGWDTGSGSLEIDVHRLFQMLRSSLIRANAIWTTMTGFSYYYIGIGNEIGYDSANNFPNSIPVSTKPFTGSGGSQYENTITGNVRLIHENPAVVPSPDTRWWSKPWLGELFPDSVYATWLATGNIPTGTGTGKFVRANRGGFPPFTGTVLTDSVRRTNAMGSTTLFWTGNANATFHHEYKDGDQASITAAGTDIANNYSLPVPDTIDNARPFAIDYNSTGYNPENFLQAGDYPNAYLTKVLFTYYSHSGAPIQGSALVSLVDPSTNDPAFIAVNGLSPTGVAGTTFIAKWSFLTLIQSYLNGGLYTDAVSAPASAKHIRQVPRVVITDPNINTDLKQKSSITVGWTTTWQRWDGQQYTADARYAGWVETLTMKYAVIYSPSNGFADAAHGNPTGWFYIKDNTFATPGVKPNTAHEIAQAITVGTTNVSTTWNTPAATFPQGNYLIRVEGYREGWPLHYAFHQYRAFLQR